MQPELVKETQASEAPLAYSVDQLPYGRTFTYQLIREGKLKAKKSGRRTYHGGSLERTPGFAPRPRNVRSLNQQPRTRGLRGLRNVSKRFWTSRHLDHSPAFVKALRAFKRKARAKLHSPRSAPSALDRKAWPRLTCDGEAHCRTCRV